MRGILLIGVLLFLAVLLTGCGQYDEDETEIFATGVISSLEFSSLEEFLACYIIASEGRSGGDISEFVSGFQMRFSDSDLAEVVADTNFTAFETLYLPVGIPEDFQLHRITVNEVSVALWFLHEDDLVSERAIWDAIANQRRFHFIISRWDYDSSALMENVLRQNNATREDLIDGKYLFVAPNMFIWTSDREILSLYTPLPSYDAQEEFPTENLIADFWVNPDDPASSTNFAGTVSVDLSDTDEVLELIEEGAPDLVSILVDELEFASLEEFLGSYIIATDEYIDGAVIADLVKDWSPAFSDSDFTEVVKGTGFTSLETLYLPMGIPEGFELYRMTVNERFVSAWYLHEDDMVSEEAIREALDQGRYILFRVSGRDADAETLMEGVLRRNRAAAEDLIDDKYLFVALNRLVWTTDGSIFRLRMPESLVEDVLSLIRFAGIGTVDLSDTDEIMDLVGDEMKEIIEEITREATGEVAEDTARILQNRVQIFLSERGKWKELPLCDI